MTPKPHERLASAIETRRGELGLSLREVAELAGITGETLRAVRKGSNEPSSLTKRGIERALRWAPGSVDLVLAGRGPGGERSPMDEAEAMMDENEEIAARLVERIRRLRRDQRRLVEDLVRMLEADSAAAPDHRSKSR